MSKKDETVVRTLLEQQGRTYASEAGIGLRDTPVPLFRLLVLSHLLSARIRAEVAVATARSLFASGMGSPHGMIEATWQERVDALGRGGYRRYDERTATQLGELAEQVERDYRGDLRRLREADNLQKALQEFPGIGPTGAHIFLREVQGIWPEVAPHLDRKALDGSERLGLPTDPQALARLVAPEDLPRLAAALVRVALHAETAEEVLEAA